MQNKEEHIFKKILKKKNYWLITGVAGFIGSNLLETLIKNNQVVIGIDNFSSGRKKNISKFLKNYKKNFFFLKKDINKLKFGDLKDKPIEYVVHLAAMTSVYESLKKPDECHKINTVGFERLIANIIKVNSVKKILYASSAAVYGNNLKTNSENSKLRPMSPYALSKIQNEKTAKKYSLKSKFSFIGFRFFNIYGKNQNPSSQYASVISKWTDLIKKGKKIEIYGNGENTRDFCHVNNVIFFLIYSINKKLNKNEIFNLGSGNSISLNKLAKILINNYLKRKNYSDYISYKDFKKGDIFKSSSNINKIKRKIYYKIPFNGIKYLKYLT